MVNKVAFKTEVDVSDQFHVPVALSPEKLSQYRFCRRLDGPTHC
jgi:5-hydroxyisourate hydrolase-like protein (transthyretin family)